MCYYVTVPCKGLYLTAEIVRSEEEEEAASGVSQSSDEGDSGQTNMWGEREDHTFRGLATAAEESYEEGSLMRRLKRDASQSPRQRGIRG